MARSYFFGLTPDKELVGGDTALITLKNQKESLFEWFKKHECIVGFIATHWSVVLLRKQIRHGTVTEPTNLS